MLCNAAQRPNNNANPLGLSEKKMFIAWKVCSFVGKVEILLYIKNHSVAFLIGFGDA